MQFSPAKIYFPLVLSLLIFTRYYMLGHDFVGFDDFHFKNWSYVFMKEFEDGNWDKLLVTIQPGALTIYSNIIGFKLAHFFADKLHLFDSTQQNFGLVLNTFQKIPQSTLIIILLVVSSWVVRRIFNAKVAILFLLLAAIEPMFIAHSRAIQTDMLQAITMLNSLLFAIYYLKEKRYKFLIISAIFGGLAFIQKSPGILLIGVIPLIFFLEMLHVKISRITFKRFLNSSLIYTFILIIAAYLLFPAFWLHPIATFKRMTIDAFLFGVSGVNTENYSYSEYTQSSIADLTYLNYLIFRFTPIYLLGLILGLYFIVKDKLIPQLIKNRPFIYVLIFAVLYFLMLQISEKKFDRYMIVSLLPITIFSAYGYHLLAKKVSAMFFGYTVLIISLYGIINYFYWMPDVIGYSNFLRKMIYGNSVVYDWGAGYYRLGRYIENNYGTSYSVAIGDPNSLKLFYEGEVYDINEANSQDMLIYQLKDKPIDPPGYTLDSFFGVHNEPNFLIYKKL